MQLWMYSAFYSCVLKELNTIVEMSKAFSTLSKEGLLMIDRHSAYLEEIGTFVSTLMLTL